MEDGTGRLGLKRQVCQSLRQVLQLRLQERRSRVELLRQGTMPRLNASAVALREQKGSLDCSRTDESLRGRPSSGPEPSDPTRILQETVKVPSLEAARLQQKRARLGGEVNKKISHRPAPTFRHILPLPSRIQPAIKKTRPPKLSDESCDEDSSCSLSPGLWSNPGPLLGLQLQPTPQQVLAGSSAAPPAMQCISQAPPPSGPGPCSNVTGGMVTQSTQPSDSGLTLDSVLSQKQFTDNKKYPKVKKLKYHQYVHPDQKNNKRLPAPSKQSSGRALHQQHQQHQQQQQHPPILPTLTKPSHFVTSPSGPLLDMPSFLAPLRQVGPSSALLGPRKPAGLLPSLDDMRVIDLRSELKRQGLAVSGPKNELIERLKYYQELKRGCSSTSLPTAGGTQRSVADRGASATTDSSPAGAPHQILHYQTFLNLQPAAAKPPAVLSSDVLPPASSFSTSPCNGNTEDNSIDVLEDVVSPPRTHQLSAVSQLQISVKEEPSPLAWTPCQFSGRKQKHCQVSWPRPASSASLAAGASVDKDKLLQEKDQQIQELTTKLVQKEQLVEMLRFQLEIRMNGGLPESTVHVKVKQEPPDSSSSPPSLIHPPSPPFTPTEEMVAIKQEVIKEEEVVSQTAPGLPQSAKTKHACRFSQTQLMQKLMQPQECDVQTEERTNENRDRTLEDLQNHSEQQLKREGQQTPQVYQICLYPLEVLKSKPTPTLVTEGDDFLIAANQISLQRLQSAVELHGNHLAELRQKAVEREGGFMEVILQSGEWAASKPATDPLDYLKPVSPGSPPPSSPLQLALSPVTSPRRNVTPARPERQTRVEAREEHRCPGGRLEDFFESTVGESLLGAEPDGLLSLINDLHSQMCTPSISECPQSCRDASSTGTEEEHDLDLSVGAGTCEDNSTLGPLGPQPPSSVFSTDFLDSFDLQILTV